MSGRKGKSYSQDDLIKAVDQAKKKGYSIAVAARNFCVPRKTVSDHVSGKIVGFNKPGGDRMLSPDEETAVVDYVVYMGRMNFPLRRKDLRATIVEIIKTSGPERVLTCKFNLSKGPSDNWFKKFEANHPELKWSIPETLDKARSSQSTEYIIDHFFNTYEDLLKKWGLFDKPSQIFNADESGISSHVATRQRAYGVKAEKLYQQKVAQVDHITSMTAISACGRVLPNFLIFEKNIPTLSVKDILPKSWFFGSSPNGYMDKELFQSWFIKIFIPNCGKERPVLLVIDNHESHISLEVIKQANDNEIHILGLPAHTTHILQPLDVGVFGHVKRKYNELCLSAGLKSAHCSVSKANFPIVWKNAISQAATPVVVRNAFKRSGLFPFDPTAIDDSKIKKVNLIDVPTLENATVAKKRAKVDNSAIAKEPRIDLGLACEKCGRYAPPVASIVKLPAEMEHCFQFNVPQVPAQRQVKKRRVITHERVISCANIKIQVEEKEEKARKEFERLEERRKKKMEKESQVAMGEERGEPSGTGVAHSEDEITMGECDIDSICHFCKEEFPPCKGRGKQKRSKNISWLCCDFCNNWYHCFCVNINAADIPDTYKCPSCIKNAQ